jgi:hypothetical protein
MSAVAEAYGARTAVTIAAVLAIVIVLIFYVSSRARRAMDAHVESALAEDSGQPSFALPR